MDKNSKNVIDHLAHKFFSGSQTKFAKWEGIGQSTMATRKAANSVPADAQKRILQKSDAEDLGIRPIDFFPDRLGDARGVVT